MKFILIILLMVGCVNGEWEEPSQDSAPKGSVNLVEFNF
jgi:hypothetical protein